MNMAATKDSKQEMNATVTAIEAVGDDIKIIRLRPALPFTWQAGQYLNISFGDLPVRAYSIANAPGHNELEIHIKRGKGDASLYVMDKLSAGEQVTISGPEGSSVYDDVIDEPVLAIAGGLGIAPLKAITEQALHAGHHKPFILCWGTSSPEEKYLQDYFEDFAAAHGHFTFIAVHGRPITEAVTENFGHLGDHRIFISGPPAMIGALVPLLRDKGATPEKISYDRHPEAANIKI